MNKKEKEKIEKMSFNELQNEIKRNSNANFAKKTLYNKYLKRLDKEIFQQKIINILTYCFILLQLKCEKSTPSGGGWIA